VPLKGAGKDPYGNPEFSNDPSRYTGAGTNSMDYSFGRGDGVNRSYQEENKDDASSGNPLSSGAGGAGYAASRDLERGGGGIKADAGDQPVPDNYQITPKSCSNRTSLSHPLVFGFYP